MSKRNSLLDLYENHLLFTKVYSLLQEQKSYDYILKFLDAQGFKLSKGSLSKLKAKITESEETGVPIDSLLDKRRKTGIDDVDSDKVEGYVGNPNKQGDTNLPDEPYDIPAEMVPSEHAYSSRQVLESIMDKGFATVQAARVIDLPTTLKAIDMYNKYYYQESKGLTAEALKQYQLINSSIMSAIIDTIPKYVAKDKQEQMMEDMNNKAAEIIENAGATKDGKELLKQLEKEGLTL